MNKESKHLSIPFATAWAATGMIIAALGSYYGTVNATNGKVDATNAVVGIIQSKQQIDEQNIAAVQTTAQLTHDVVIRMAEKFGIPTGP